MGITDAEDMRQIDGVTHDVHFVDQGRRDVDRCIGDDEGARIKRRLHHETVGDPPLGTQ
ncbi:hypothetical protein D3C85_1867670 [compost metagenome]